MSGDVWYAPSEQRWWMEPEHVTHPIAFVLNHTDAILVTNATDILDDVFLEHLRDHSGDEGLSYED